MQKIIETFQNTKRRSHFISNEKGGFRYYIVHTSNAGASFILSSVFFHRPSSSSCFFFPPVLFPAPSHLKSSRQSSSSNHPPQLRLSISAIRSFTQITRPRPHNKRSLLFSRSPFTSL
jgi:hypothetical protein